MIRSLYTAASGLETGLHMEDVVAENLANATTTGFKGERSSTHEFAGVLARSIGPAPVPVPLMLETTLGRIGTGSYLDSTRVALQEGTPRSTNEPLDVMISGQGFFAVQSPTGNTHYTRDGHFGRDAQNRLITADGSLVLGQNGNPITVNTDKVRIDRTGQIFAQQVVTKSGPNNTTTQVVQETQVGTLQVVNVSPTALVRAGESQFTVAAGVTPTAVQLGGTTTVLQGSLEQSNVDIASTTADLMSLARDYSASQRVFMAVNQTLQETVHDVGRVA